MIKFKEDLYEGRYLYCEFRKQKYVMRFTSNTNIKNYFDRLDDIKWVLFRA